MAFQPEIKEEVFRVKKVLGQEKYTTNIVINSEQKITQVLSVGAKSCVSANNVTMGAVSIDGQIYSKAIITNSELQYSSIDNNTQFNFHYVNNGINNDSIIFSTSKVTEITNIQATDNSLSFTVTILIVVYQIVEQKIKYIQEINNLSYQKKGQISYSNVVCATTKEFDVINEVELPNNIGSVIQVESNAIINNTDVTKDLVSVDGKVFANLIYLTNEEKPRLKNQTYIVEFNQEILCNNVNADNQATTTLETCCTNYEIQGELNSAKGVLILKNSMRANIFVNEQKFIDTVVDMFCPKYELHTNTISFVKRSNKYSDTINEKIDGNIVLTNEDARIDRVLATSSNLVVSNVSIDENLDINGKLYTNVIYQLDDDNSTISSVLAEIPFNLAIKLEDVKNTDDITFDIMLTDIEARNKRAKEIDIIADATIVINIDKEETDAVISDIKLGDKLDVKLSPMGIYYVNEANDLWDVAKYLKVLPEQITKQNPNLEFPITRPTKIIVYREREI